MLCPPTLCSLGKLSRLRVEYSFQWQPSSLRYRVRPRSRIKIAMQIT